ncbi:hypothetical protein K450DRAFT_245273 [Umbelopsis ramanniana AG]|uniref:BHLH domain-containing protein n=1 Tax=Umbelopsis ramanniana AG TaxID=1314678 RepID=A0AAD5E7A3_UMBRA|nr:uncharacterized protein K450DRAFT_245273 [Umbelopsis ramanniana AG]KAI8578736.1 hypothetical protein K450DRAFT_245273 [Umbelopsis ramanniana AG]
MATDNSRPGHLLPSPRDLLSSSSRSDMVVDTDERKWDSPPAKHHPHSPMPDQYSQPPSQSTDEYLHHRMSGMFLNRPTATPNIATNTGGRPESQAQHFSSSNRTLSPLEPAHQSPSYTYNSRRGSITDPALHSSEHRPSLHDINLPIPTSRNVSRRGSIATNDAPSRSPSPAPFAQAKPYDDPYYNHYAHRQSNAAPPPPPSGYEPFQRRHSIANSELPQPPSTDPNRRFTGFHFPAIKEDKRGGPFSAPSSPPPTHSAPYPPGPTEQDGFQSRYPPNDHYQPYPTNRRTSQLVDEGNNGGPILGRRASLPVVGLNRAREPYTSPSDPRAPRPDHLRDYGSTMGKPETPYSRSPELRVSHKLAERKRRKEMKELFDELRDSLPLDRNLKQSKWEILSKAVEFIGTLKQRDYDMGQEISALRSELGRLRHEQQPPQ